VNPDASGSLAAVSVLAATSVGDLSLRPHARIDASASVGDAVDEMRVWRRGAVLVEDGGALVGIFTERDLLNRVDHRDPRWAEVGVREVMTAHPVVTRAGASLAEALHSLIEGRRRHLPIVDEHGQVIGLLSIRDILAYVASRFPEEMINLPPDPDHER
jgi:CBS domain-containing protein